MRDTPDFPDFSECDISAALDGKFTRVTGGGKIKTISVARDFIPEHHRRFEYQQECGRRGGWALQRRKDGRS